MSYYTRDNPFAPNDPDPIGYTADGQPCYAWNDVVTLDGVVYLRDDLDVDTVLSALGIRTQPAQEVFNDF